MKMVVSAAILRAIERATSEVSSTVGPVLLVLSGVGGAVFWPPPGLHETYATIAWMTTLYGIEGPITRAAMGALCLFVLLFADRASARKSAQVASLVVILALIVNFVVAKHGLAAGQWFGVWLYGVAALLRGELLRIRDGKAAIIEQRRIEGAESYAN